MHKLLFVLGSLFAGLMSVSAQTYLFTTWAGSPRHGYADGQGRGALFNAPRDLALDQAGNLFVADTGNHVIRKVTPAGVVTTLAGTAGVPGHMDGPGGAARFNFPSSLAVDRAGNVYVADNATLRKVTPAGLVTTVAGATGERGSVDGPGSAARFGFVTSSPLYTGPHNDGIAVGGDGSVYVTDTTNHTIRKVTAAGMVTTLAGRAGQLGVADGNGVEARFSSLITRLTVDGAGNVYVVDLGNVRKISPQGDVTTFPHQYWYGGAYGVTVDRANNLYVLNSDDGVGDDWGEVLRMTPDGSKTNVAGGWAGSADGTGNAARFFNPKGITVDESGVIFVADTGNHAIRKITAARVVTTLAGDLPGGFVDATGNEARMGYSSLVTNDPAGNVYVFEGSTGEIRKLSPSGPVTVVTATGRPISPYLPENLAVDGVGNIFVASSRFGALHKLSPTGTVTATALDASALAADGVGNLFFARKDHTIGKMTPDGRITSVAGASGSRGHVDGIGGAARFSNPNGIAVNRRGEVYVVDSGNGTIRRISPDGLVTTVTGFAGQPDGSGGPLKIVVAGDDRILAVNADTVRRIVDGVVVATATILNPGNDGVSSSMAVDGIGTIYVAYPATNTVRKAIPVSTAPPPSRLGNASIRANLRSDQTLVVGFDLRGDARSVLLRAIGPGLQPFAPGVTLAGDPRLALFDPSGTMIASNDNWDGGPDLTAAFLSAGAFPLAPGGADAALFRSVAGQGTVHITSMTSGTGLVEVFDRGTTDGSGIRNVSARQVIGDGADSSFTLGFTIEGPAAKTVLIRGIGPALAAAPFHLGRVLADPTFAVFKGAQKIAENNRWDASLTTLFPLVGAFALPPGSQDAALLLTLEPGGYSAILRDGGGAAGEAMIEIYDVR